MLHWLNRRQLFSILLFSISVVPRPMSNFVPKISDKEFGFEWPSKRPENIRKRAGKLFFVQIAGVCCLNCSSDNWSSLWSTRLPAISCCSTSFVLLGLFEVLSRMFIDASWRIFLTFRNKLLLLFLCRFPLWRDYPQVCSFLCSVLFVSCCISVDGAVKLLRGWKKMLQIQKC